MNSGSLREIKPEEVNFIVQHTFTVKIKAVQYIVPSSANTKYPNRKYVIEMFESNINDHF